MRKSQGAISLVEVALTLPIFSIMLMCLFESWKFVYIQNSLNQVVNYSVTYWAKNDLGPCADAPAALEQTVIIPMINKFGLKRENISLVFDNSLNCETPGEKISLYAEMNNWTLESWGLLAPKAYAIAIKEGYINA